MGLSTELHIAPKVPTSRIAIRAGKKILFIDSADIIAVEAEGHYVLLQHKSRGYLLRESISTMAEKLSLLGFVRIHRSSLVNTAFVEEIQPLSTGEYMLSVRGGKKYTVTRTYKKNLHLLAESWIGTDGFGQIERGLIDSD
jgi:DNA-binding LytR/AlgR family response regulator